MSFSTGLSAGLRALTAARMGIETAGQNVANANTPGYSRQSILQAATLPFNLGRGLQIGTGVEVTGIRRMVDTGLERRIRLQIGSFGTAQVDHARWSEIESVFNEPDGGLSTSFTRFFGSMKKLQAEPGNSALRGGMATEANALTNAMNELTRRFEEIESSSFDEISGHVWRVNEYAHAVSRLNDQIAVMEGSGSAANDLRDERARLIKDMGELVDVSVLERNTGAADVMVGGLLLVAGNRVNELEVSRDPDHRTTITMRGTNAPVNPTGGKIEGLLRHEDAEVPSILAKLDKMAKNLALEFNRLHTTGVPLAGYYQQSVSSITAKDLNRNGTFGDELLSESGFPFDISNGEVYIGVTDLASGAFERSKISISPASMTLQDVAAEINAVANVNASVDPAGKLRVTSDAGFGFEFSPKADPNPDQIGSFGGAQPSFASSSSGPFSLSVPSTLRVTIDGSNYDVNFSAAQFINSGAATVDEVAAAINSTPGFSADGFAENVGGRLVIQSNNPGSSSTLALSEPGPGTPLAQLSLPPSPNSITGQDSPIQVTIGGQFTGDQNGQFVFVAEGTGTIGVDSGLTIGVFDQDGVRVATLDAGPNTELLEGGPVAVADGLTLSLTPGNLTDGQVFSVDTLADSDTSDFLVAIGMNSFFHGSSAGDITVNRDIRDNPNLLAAGTLGESGDASNLERMLNLRDLGLSSLNKNSFEDYYGDMIGHVGFEASGAETILFAEDQLLGSLNAQRESISGVNLDEEMLDLVSYQQAFEAASRFINVVNELTDTLINLGR